MKIINPPLALRLCALAKLHTDGAGALTESIGYSSSNLMSVIAGRRNMPTDVIERLSEALSFDNAGFRNDGIIESWLARKVDDLRLLLDLGFDFSVLCRLATDRETNNPTGVLYKYALLRVNFGATHRNVVLRMTREGIDHLMVHPQVRNARVSRHAPEGLPTFRYLDFGKLKELRAVAVPSTLSLQGPGEPSSEQIRLLVEHIRATVQSDEPSDAANKAQSAPLSVAAEKVKRHRLYASAIKEAYGLRGSRQPHLAHGVSVSGVALPVEIHPIFLGEAHERVLPAKTANDHLVVVQEHANGVIEVIYEGPRSLVCPQSAQTSDSPSASKKAQGRAVTAAEFRALNATVQTADRLSTTRPSRSE